MSHSVPPARPPSAAATGEPNPAARTLPAFERASPIEREIARSERASAALAAVAALARASTSDQSADDPLRDPDEACDAWARTEYLPLDGAITGAVPAPAVTDSRGTRIDERRKATRPLKAGDGVPDASDARAAAARGPASSVLARGGGRGAAPSADDGAASSGVDSAAGVPTRPVDFSATRVQAQDRATAARGVRPRGRAESADSGRLLLAGMFGAALMLVGGVAWKYVTRPLPVVSASALHALGAPAPSVAAPTTAAAPVAAAPVQAPAPASAPALAAATPPATAGPGNGAAADAELARSLASARAEIVVPPTAAGAQAQAAQGAQPDVVAEALARAARVVAQSRTHLAAANAAPAHKAAAAAATGHKKDPVAAAVAHAQARSDGFLAGSSSTAAAPPRDPASAP